MEKFKTILLILFLVGIVGAFNSIIRLSQQNGESPLRVLTTALGITPRPTPEPLRKVDDFIFNRGQSVQTTTATQQDTSRPNPTLPPQAQPTPTPNSAIRTQPELPPLPPISNVRGAKTENLPPLPPIREQKTLGEKSDQADTFAKLGTLFKDIASYFGF